MSNIGSYDLLNLIGALLAKKWAPTARAKVVVAESPAHAVEIMSGVRSSTPVAVVFYTADAPAGDDAVFDTALDATIRVGVLRKMDFGIKGSKAPKVLQSVDSLRKFMASDDAVLDDVLGGHCAYEGMSFMATSEGRMLNGYALTYSPRYAYEV